MDLTKHENLRNTVNEILQLITKQRLAEVPFNRGGVNWADLRCSNVEYIVDITGDEYYRVTIEEVSPTEYDLQLRVAQELVKFGYPYVEVRTEW